MTTPPAGWRAGVPLAPRTTLGLGGPARWLVECDGEAAVRAALAEARARALPVFVLGGGSNVVVRDAGFPGLVVVIAIGGAEFRADGTAEAGAGVVWDEFVRQAVERGLQGIECLSGIPGTVGGTPIQNVGAYGQEVSETIERVVAVDRTTLERVELAGSECGFGYRTSRFKGADRDRFVVTAVRFRLRPGAAPVLRYRELADAVSADPAWAAARGAQLTAVRNAVLGLRRGKAMVVDPADPDTRSVGSFFTNPVLTRAAFERLEALSRAAGGRDPVPAFPVDGGVKVPAAWLIERAGYRKGFRAGGVGISSRHALALVNAGGTSAELLALADEIERTVARRFDVRLEREPVIVG